MSNVEVRVSEIEGPIEMDYKSDSESKSDVYLDDSEEDMILGLDYGFVDYATMNLTPKELKLGEQRKWLKRTLMEMQQSHVACCIDYILLNCVNYVGFQKKPKRGIVNTQTQDVPVEIENENDNQVPQNGNEDVGHANDEVARGGNRGSKVNITTEIDAATEIVAYNNQFDFTLGDLTQ
ncbi:hypothetical protein JHK87_010643 [Glycine soja]|nr:hypothetical protein JHK87_010643 [Glycine soja]